MRVPPHVWRGVVDHLLPREPEAEEAAFFFAVPGPELDVVDHLLVPPEAYNYRSMGHLDLTEGMHEYVIRHAHELGAAVIEVHSHPYDCEYAACFSSSDRAGFCEVVPHVMWRLPGRPYVAIVVAPRGFDALVWTTCGANPVMLEAVHVGRRVLHPTGHTLSRPWGFHGPL